MPWITLLEQEPLARVREAEVPWPQQATHIEVRANWDNASRLDPARHLACLGFIMTRGAASTAKSPFPQVSLVTSGAPDLPQPGDLDDDGNPIPDVFPQTGNPVQMPAWAANKYVRFEMQQYHDNGGPPMKCGLQIKWRNAAGQELNANGQVI
jgi:hypothetical protein